MALPVSPTRDCSFPSYCSQAYGLRTVVVSFALNCLLGELSPNTLGIQHEKRSYVAKAGLHIQDVAVDNLELPIFLSPSTEDCDSGHEPPHPARGINLRGHNPT